jgi:hypothetical protein
MGHSRTPTQNTAGDGFPADPIDGYTRWSFQNSATLRYRYRPKFTPAARSLKVGRRRLP